MITTTQLAQMSYEPAIRFIKRCILRAKIKTWYAAADYYDDQIKSGREGMKYAHLKLINLEAQERDLK